MAGEIKATLKSPDLYRMARKMNSEGRAFSKAVLGFAGRMGKRFITYFKKTYFTRGNPRPGVHKRSGRLASAFSSIAKLVGASVHVQVSNSSPYYDSHATPGGFGIVSSGKLMPIPLNPATATERKAKEFHGPFTRDQYRMVKVNGKLFLYNKQLRQLTHVLKRFVYQPQRVKSEVAVVAFKKQVLEPESEKFLAKWAERSVKK